MRPCVEASRACRPTVARHIIARRTHTDTEGCRPPPTPEHATPHVIWSAPPRTPPRQARSARLDPLRPPALDRHIPPHGATPAVRTPSQPTVVATSVHGRDDVAAPPDARPSVVAQSDHRATARQHDSTRKMLQPTTHRPPHQHALDALPAHAPPLHERSPVAPQGEAAGKAHKDTPASDGGLLASPHDEPGPSPSPQHDAPTTQMSPRLDPDASPQPRQQPTVTQAITKSRSADTRHDGTRVPHRLPTNNNPRPATTCTRHRSPTRPTPTSFPRLAARPAPIPSLLASAVLGPTPTRARSGTRRHGDRQRGSCSTHCTRAHGAPAGRI